MYAYKLHQYGQTDENIAEFFGRPVEEVPKLIEDGERFVKYVDCPPPDDDRGDVLPRLESIHKKMHSGGSYGFEQSIWCDLLTEIKRLRQMLDASHHPTCEARTRGIGAPGCICKTVKRHAPNDV